MNFRLIEWHQSIYIVLGIGYNKRYDPPDVFYVTPLTNTLVRSILLNLELIEVPFSEAEEITDLARIQTIWILYGK